MELSEITLFIEIILKALDHYGRKNNKTTLFVEVTELFDKNVNQKSKNNDSGNFQRLNSPKSGVPQGLSGISVKLLHYLPSSKLNLFFL